MRKEISYDKVRELFDYDSKSGELIWKERSIEQCKTKRGCTVWNKKYAGKPAGAVTEFGYKRINIKGSHYRAHRVVWMWHKGEWPKHQIDHINGNRMDNRIENLRDVEPKYNSYNMNKVRGVVPLKGVWFVKRDGTFQAGIRKEGKLHHLGIYSTAEEAHAAYCVKAKELFGEYANFGS